MSPSLRDPKGRSSFCPCTPAPHLPTWPPHTLGELAFPVQLTFYRSPFSPLCLHTFESRLSTYVQAQVGWGCTLLPPPPPLSATNCVNEKRSELGVESGRRAWSEREKAQNLGEGPETLKGTRWDGRSFRCWRVTKISSSTSL